MNLKYFIINPYIYVFSFGEDTIPMVVTVYLHIISEANTNLFYVFPNFLQRKLTGKFKMIAQ